MHRPTFIRLGRLALVACAAFAVQTASAQEGEEDLATYCAITAGQYCLNTYGYDSQECQDQYISNCMNGAGPRGTEHGPRGTYDPARDCTGGTDQQGRSCTRV